VQSVAAQTLRDSSLEQDVREALDARLIALSDAHNLLTEQNWEGATLGAVVEMALRPYRSEREDRFAVDGPEVRLPPKTALAIAMALHELTTNAIKYGALSNDSGRVLVVWDVVEAPESQRLTMSWSERGGPPVLPPKRKGFGTRLVSRGLAAELGGTVDLSFAAEGVVCTIDAHLRAGGAGSH
jgi:two-component sensor histidine kinase